MKNFLKGNKNLIKFPCDICGDLEYIQEHHIRGRKIPFANSKSNLCKICVKCHTLLHKGEILIEGWIITNKGRELFWHKKGEDNFSGQKTEPHIFGEKVDSEGPTS